MKVVGPVAWAGKPSVEPAAVLMLRVCAARVDVRVSAGGGIVAEGWRDMRGSPRPQATDDEFVGDLGGVTVFAAAEAAVDVAVAVATRAVSFNTGPDSS